MGVVAAYVCTCAHSTTVSFTGYVLSTQTKYMYRLETPVEAARSVRRGSAVLVINIPCLDGAYSII